MDLAGEIGKKDAIYGGCRVSSCCVTNYDSPVGRLTIAGTGAYITGLWLEGQKYFGATLTGHRAEELPVFQEAKQWLDLYFAGVEPTSMPPLAPVGSPFRQAVWRLLRQIPYGQVTTYGKLAAQLEQMWGKAVSAQAVGGAVGHNPISILIPCHRVVGANGSLTGYAGGIQKKVCLLRLENAPLEGLFVPKTGTAL